MNPADLQGRALTEIRRIESFLSSLSPNSFEFLRNLLAYGNLPPTSREEPEQPTYELPEKIGRLRTSAGTLKLEILEAIEALDRVTSVAVHARLVKKEFKFSTREPRREVSSIAAWLRKFCKQGILVQTHSGRGRRPVEFRKVKTGRMSRLKRGST